MSEPSEPGQPAHPYPLTGKRRRRPEEGTLEVFVTDEQADQPVDTRRWARLAEQVLEGEGMGGDAELSLLFVDEAAMADLNQRFMGHQGPTDVLAFPIDDDLVQPGRFPDNGTSRPTDPTRDEAIDVPLMLGDIVICPAVAARNAPTHAGNYADELALLVVHGLLHVFGMDHAEPAEAAAMQARERELLDRYYKQPQ